MRVVLNMLDVIVIGGGVIGLSIAWELSSHGLAVRVLEQGSFGQEASWAGAGMLPPGNLGGARTTDARLRGATNQLWPDWSARLKSQTGMDNGFIHCGGVETWFKSSTGGSSPLPAEITELRNEGVTVEEFDRSTSLERFPALGPDVGGGFFLPDFCQVRNPRHLQALQIGCSHCGVELISGARVQQIETHAGRIQSVSAAGLQHQAAEFVFAGGAWTAELLGQIGVQVSIEPIKGQIVLLRRVPPPINYVIEVGREYLVPRNDGRILVGSTEERSGFDKRTTARAVGDLIQFAQRLVPDLKDAQFERCWAGLRPYSATGKPYIGRLPQFANACIAAGHYRYGLQLSPVTAVLIRQTILKQPVLVPDACLPSVGDVRVEQGG